MLSELYLDTIKNKEKKISIMHGDSFESILKMAQDKWVDYIPMKKPSVSVGIDSSWNKKSFQGIDLYVVDCVAVNSQNNILCVDWDYGINNIGVDLLSSKAMHMEIDLALLSMKKNPDILCIDGSIISNLLHNTSNTYLQKVVELFEHMSYCPIIVFLSKNSNTRNQFKEWNSKAADIFYFNKLGFKSGYSLPHQNGNFRLSNSYGIIEVYARLSPYVPLIKIEIVNNSLISNKDIQLILDMLYYHSIKGYPYCLKLAHKTCKITNADIKRIASVYGLKNEFGSRDSLNE